MFVDKVFRLFDVALSGQGDCPIELTQGVAFAKIHTGRCPVLSDVALSGQGDCPVELTQGVALC